MHGPSLLWAEFMWADSVMGRLCDWPSLLWAEMPVSPLYSLSVYSFLRIIKVLSNLTV